MAELITNNNYQDFTLAMLQTPDGIAKLNSILSQLSQNISGDTEQVRVYSGVGTPEASIAAGVGSLYMRTDGGADTSVYRKESGSGNTGWIAIKAPASLPLSTANGGLGADFSTGTSGYVLYFSSTGTIGVRPLSTTQLFIASGTFIAPAGITKVYLTMLGGGGGGAGPSGGNSAGGGGSGAYVIDYPYTVVAGSSYTVTINNGGTAGSSGNAGDGGTVIFDALTINGGKGGTQAAPGLGGAGGIGQVAAVLGTGGSGQGTAGNAGVNGRASPEPSGGAGAGSYFGGIGGNAQNGDVGLPGTGFGAGGAGGSTDAGGGSDRDGGVGTKGFVLVKF